VGCLLLAVSAADSATVAARGITYPDSAPASISAEVHSRVLNCYGVANSGFRAVATLDRYRFLSLTNARKFREGFGGRGAGMKASRGSCDNVAVGVSGHDLGALARSAR